MPKVLITIAFAITVDDEDDIVRTAREIDSSLRRSIAEAYTPEMAAFVDAAEADHSVDWYGATISIKQSVFAGVEE